jgi:predicted ATP-dependent endonuclease of OLD family
MELSLIGLQNAGKTSLVNVITVCLSAISPSLSICLYVWMSVSLSLWLSF